MPALRTWPHDLGPTYRPRAQSRTSVLEFRLRLQRNLAAMVDNKADLVQPRGEVPPYTGRRTTVLDKYHRGESTATVYPGLPTKARSATWANDDTKLHRGEGPAVGGEHIAAAPRVSIQAFCETVETAAAIQAAGEDRRLGRRISRFRWAA